MLNVHLRITDAATTRPIPVRVRVTSADGTHFAPLGCAAEFPTGRNEDVGGRVKLGRERWWYIDGACEMPLPAGVPLRVQVAKGPEWTPLDETVTLGGGQISLRFAISRWADTRTDGWMSIDTRCHFLTPHAALLEAQAEDVNVVNVLAMPFPLLALDANTYTTLPNLLAVSGQVPALERAGCSVVVNTFNTHPVLGKVALLNSHRPVFPLSFGGEETDDWGVCDWCDQCHRKKGLTVWVDAFEPAGGLTGGEALVAAILGKIDAIEVTGEPRKTPLLPWVYRLWDAGVLLPLVGASAKDSNKTALGSMRTYARVQEPPPPAPLPAGRGELASEETGTSLLADASLPLPAGRGLGGGFSGGPLSWLDAVRVGRTVVTEGPLLTLLQFGDRFRAEARLRGKHSPVELVANGQVVASGEGEAEASVSEPGWVAARCLQGEFAHTSAVRVSSPARKPEAVAHIRKMIEQTCDWVESHGRFTNPKRKQAILDRSAEAIAKLENVSGDGI
jgi:hypothetical protein